MSSWVRGLRTQTPKAEANLGMGLPKKVVGGHQLLMVPVGSQTSDDNCITMKIFFAFLPSQAFRQLALEGRTSFLPGCDHSYFYSSLGSVDHGKTVPEQLVACSVRTSQNWGLLSFWTQLMTADTSLETRG